MPNDQRPESVQLMQGPDGEPTVVHWVATAVMSAFAGIASAWLAFRAKIAQIRASHEVQVESKFASQLVSEHNRLTSFYSDLMKEVSALREQNSALLKKVTDLHDSNSEMKLRILGLENEVHHLSSQLKFYEEHPDLPKQPIGIVDKTGKQ
jgi:predicted nuclease with TOPRIM domain